jgi:hypothetical protein
MKTLPESHVAGARFSLRKNPDPRGRNPLILIVSLELQTGAFWRVT